MMDTPDIAFLITTRLGQRLGADNAITGAALRSILAGGGIRIGERAMRKIIERECPAVCFGGRGYFIPASEAEARACAGRIEHYIRGLAMRRRSILEPYQDGSQMSLGI
jgi:hypothetical protein